MRPIRFHRTTPFRLTLAYIMAFVVSAGILLGFVYWQTAGYVTRQMEELVTAELRNLAESSRQQDLADLTAQVEQRAGRGLRQGRVYLLTDRDFRKLAGNLASWPEIAPGPDGSLTFALAGAEDVSEEPHRFWARQETLPGGLHLLVGRDTEALAELYERIGGVVGSALALMAGLALLGGVIMSRGMLRRIDGINRISEGIMQGDLARRIPSRGTDDDLDRLADNLNAMLDRIEALMAAIRGVSDDIAHDLRTPLARLRTSLEMARLSPPAGDDLDAWIDDSISNVDGILSTFEALLTIAAIEAGTAARKFTRVDLARIVVDVAEVYEPLAADRKQRLETLITPGAPVRGDRHLLFRALANLLDNAIKYTPPGGRVTVRLDVDGSRSVLVVADSGPGLPLEARQKVFRRLFRLEAARSTPGSGLGLSLVAAIATLHGIRIRLDDNHPGLRVTLVFPESAPTGPRGSIESSRGVRQDHTLAPN